MVFDTGMVKWVVSLGQVASMCDCDNEIVKWVVLFVRLRACATVIMK